MVQGCPAPRRTGQDGKQSGRPVSTARAGQIQELDLGKSSENPGAYTDHLWCPLLLSGPAQLPAQQRPDPDPMQEQLEECGHRPGDVCQRQRRVLSQEPGPARSEVPTCPPDMSGHQHDDLHRLSVDTNTRCVYLFLRGRQPPERLRKIRSQLPSLQRREGVDGTRSLSLSNISQTGKMCPLH